MVNLYEVRNVEEFSGLIFATGEQVRNGVVVSSSQQVLQNETK